MLSLYIHIPFCRKVCGYCDFFRSADHRAMERVLEVMLDEIEQRCGDSEEPFFDKRLKSIYFGGGTPSLLSCVQLARFMERIDHFFDLSMLEETTLEANPDDLNLEYLRGLRELGFNRLSLGVQSFDDELLQFMGRRHSAADAVNAIESARRVGFDNIAIDLIYGVDGFGHRLRSTLQRANECDVEHIAAYHLTIEPGTRFGKMVERGAMRVVDESVSESEFIMVREALVKGGFEHYEVSNFAQLGRRSIHNSNYWSGEDYIGIGAGAHSFVNGVRRWAVESLVGYISGGEQRYGSERLTLEQRRNEMVMLSLRRVEGLELGRFESMFGVGEVGRLMEDAERFLRVGDLVVDGDRIKIPAERFLLSDMIIEALFSLGE
ncbi:MAG: radical SAM family heme chaperone HemW [Rikenellaceae bacterium]